MIGEPPQMAALCDEMGYLSRLRSKPPINLLSLGTSEKHPRTNWGKKSRT